MTTTYNFRPSGYNPTLNQQPPPRASAKPLITCAVIVLAALFCGGFGLAFFLNSRQAGRIAGTQTAIAKTPTVTPTINEWDMTGTAVYWLTYTPTPTATPSPTEDVTATPTSTGTVTPDIPATKTALVSIFIVGTQTALASQPAEPSSLAARKTPLFPTARPNTSITGDTLPPSASNYIGQVQATQQPPQVIRVTSPPEPPIVVTRVNVVVITATPFPTEWPTATLTATVTFTFTPSATATYTATASATPSETPTSTPSATFTPIPTATWTETPTPTVTPSETPTEVPTEVLPS